MIDQCFSASRHSSEEHVHQIALEHCTLVKTNYYINYVDQTIGKDQDVLNNVCHFGLILRTLIST